MTPKSSLKPDVRAELWHSFVVLLKSYAALAGMHGPEHGVMELTINSLNIVAASTTLAIGYFPAVNKGTWFLSGRSSQERGTFELNHDGSVILDGVEIDMDHAAIQMNSSLTKAATAEETLLEVLA